MSSLPTVAFFGATGDCAGYCLADSLQAGHQCIALARTPAKLTASMKAKGVSEEGLKNLSIVPGDVRDEAAVAKALQLNEQVVDFVVSGIGNVPKLQWSTTAPFGDFDRTLCEDAATTQISALRGLKASKKPLLIVISTTGIAPAGKPRDVPLVYSPLYRWLLHIPHVDKMKMEQIVGSAALEPESSRPISNFVAVKPTLLSNGEARGSNKVIAGSEDKPAIGYFIRRAEVGKWIYGNLIAKSPQADYVGKGVCLTA